MLSYEMIIVLKLIVVVIVIVEGVHSLLRDRCIEAGERHRFLSIPPTSALTLIAVLRNLVACVRIRVI